MDLKLVSRNYFLLLSCVQPELLSECTIHILLRSSLVVLRESLSKLYPFANWTPNFGALNLSHLISKVVEISIMLYLKGNQQFEGKDKILCSKLVAL